MKGSTLFRFLEQFIECPSAFRFLKTALVIITLGSHNDNFSSFSSELPKFSFVIALYTRLNGRRSTQRILWLETL